jgi:hypothetical protein
VTDKNKLSINNIAPGVLNPIVAEHRQVTTDVTFDTFLDQFKKMFKKSLNPKHTMVNRELNGICLQILSDEEAARLMATGRPQLAFEKSVKTTSKFKPKACRVLIPEIHTDRSLPKSILSPSKKDKKVIEAMFPVFFASTEELSKKPLHVGDKITIKIMDKMGGGLYVNNSRSTFSLTSMTDKGGKDASDAFRCKLLMSLKTISNNNTSIAGNVTITEEAVPKKPNNEGMYRELYIKYLYGIELLNMDRIKGLWTEGKLALELNTLIDAFGDEIGEELPYYDPIARDNFWKPLIWGLMYQVSAQVPAGLSVGGNTVLSVKAAKDNFGMFRLNRERFNEAKAALIEAEISPTILEDFNHSYLIEPNASMQFFIRDFYHYIVNISQLKIEENVYYTNEGLFSEEGGGGLLDKLFSEEDKKIITGYFTDNKNRIDLIFPEMFRKMTAAPFEAALEDGEETKSNQGATPESEAMEDLVYPEGQNTFQDWLMVNMIADPGDSKFSDSIPEPPPNPQGPEPEKPPSTPDECHSNYPPYNDYAIHVDAQKKMVRQFCESKISGDELQFLANSHKGVNNIKFADLKINCPFKIVRFDGVSGFPKDNKRWFDRNNKGLGLLHRKERYAASVYRNRNQVSHITVQTLGNNLDDEYYFKNSIHSMIALGKKIPHFIVTRTGQIIQLIDAACALRYNTPVSLASINIAFGFGQGTDFPITSERSDIAKPNCVLIKDDNIYNCHKLGTKAAFQSMQKLIRFLMSFTKVKYRLAAFDDEIESHDCNKSTIQSLGQLTGGISGMNFIFYAWTYNLALINGGKNILNEEIYS